jgi:hypothetical protein
VRSTRCKPLLLAIAALAPALFAAPACAPKYQRTADPFFRNSMSSLARSVAGAGEAVAQARDAALASRASMDALVASTETGDELVHMESRRLLALAESRFTTAQERVKNVQNNQRAFVEEWQRDMHTYSDNDLRRQARHELNTIERASDALLKSLNSALDAFPPVITSLRDDSLYLKQRRTIKPDLPPIPADNPARAAAQSTLITRTDAAVAACEDFLATVPRTPSGAAQNTVPSKSVPHNIAASVTSMCLPSSSPTG